MAEVKTQFRPEFVNRIDEIVVFHAPGREAHPQQSPGSSLRYLEERLAKLEMGLEVGESALAQLAKGRLRSGLRRAGPLKAARSSRASRTPLAKQILEGHFAAKDTIRVE